VKNPSALTLDRILGLVDEVPAVDRFPTVDALVAELGRIALDRPSVARWRRIGTSRLGEPIHSLTVGRGEHHAVVFGGVHPNEPIGGPTAIHLARTLTADAELLDELDYTWHIIGCIDPDGMRLNEGWFGASLDRGVLGRHFYRPAFNEQVAWTFPLEYKELYFDGVLPETLALMRLIDETQPTFMCGLHNGELGGAYYFLSEEAPALYQLLHAIPDHVGIPLNEGEPELPFIPRYERAIFGDIKVEDQYEFAVAMGLDPTAGFLDAGSSPDSYARRYGTFSLISELPYWAASEASNTTPTNTLYSQVLLDTATSLEDLRLVLSDVLDSVQSQLRLDTPFLRATRPYVSSLAQQIAETSHRAELPESRRPATAAEVFSSADNIHSVRIRYGGMTRRFLEAEINAGYARPTIRTQYRRMCQIYDEWAAAANNAMPATTLPIRDLVGLQYGAILAAADYAARRGDTSTRR